MLNITMFIQILTQNHNMITLIISGISVVETLISNHELMIKSWRLDRETTEKQVRDHLVHMRRIFMQKSIVFCNKKNTKILLETVSVKNDRLT